MGQYEYMRVNEPLLRDKYDIKYFTIIVLLATMRWYYTPI